MRNECCNKIQVTNIKFEVFQLLTLHFKFIGDRHWRQAFRGGGGPCYIRLFRCEPIIGDNEELALFVWKGQIIFQQAELDL